MMIRSTKNIFLLLVKLFLVCDKKLSRANDIINTTQSISGSDTLVSLGGNFELGFFSPGNSKNWYLGIWFKNIPVNSVVWVANRENPLKNRTAGSLMVVEPGRLVLLNDTDNIIWSSNASKTAHNPVAQLLDTGNLVLRDANDDHPENYLWQSFDYPTDTILAGLGLGWNYVTGVESYLTSWKTTEDPAPGEFTFHLDPAGYPQLITKRGAVTLHRTGPFNGVRLSGTPDLSRDHTVVPRLYMDKNGVHYSVDTTNRSVIPKIKFVLTPSGVGQRWAWVDRTQEWTVYTSVPVDTCDTYKLCGEYGSCQIGDFQLCRCLDKFVPRDPQGWTRSDWSSGCVRRKALNCEVGDGFLKYSGLKLPDARNSWYNKSMTLDECKVECLRNCSCMAYTNLNISEGGSGCLIWFGDLVDIRFLSEVGQDLYIRVSSSEIGSTGKRREIILVSSAVGMALLGLTLLLYILKRKKNDEKRRKRGRQSESINSKDLELSAFEFSVISKATNDFSLKNKIGEGGYGPVFKGTLEDGQDIAVKRLSETSKQGIDEFMNEVICIARHQHRNLVKLLGCCIQGDERMLIYEYMSNKSLDLFLFDEENRMSLDWHKRFHIVNGIARGLMYLHQDSRLRIIHRDLKASNILLDEALNPKISDFGLAKRFRENEIEDMTSRVMGTYGYMSPEYAVHGRYSIKSDVFSFGVLVLEIVTGKRNSAFSHGDRQVNLLGHAWTLYNEGRSTELVDPCLHNTQNLGEVLRLIHVGLLCVQQCPDDRPSMTSVVAMLSNEAVLPHANHPGFFIERDKFTSGSLASTNNELSITIVDGR